MKLMENRKTSMQELFDNLQAIDITVPIGVKEIFLEKEKQQEKSILEEAKNKYMQELFYKSQLLSNTVIGLNPTIGYHIKVQEINISERFFKEEFDEITKAYFSVIKKIQEYKKK